jgi:hypothetical protein
MPTQYKGDHIFACVYCAGVSKLLHVAWVYLIGCNRLKIAVLWRSVVP